MGAMGGRALAPMFLHPLQYGVANLGKAYCLNPQKTEELLVQHRAYCSQHDSICTTFPEPGTKLKFKSIKNVVECSIKIYADFESLLVPIDKTSGDTKLYQKHVPVAFSLVVVPRVEGFSMKAINYVGKDAEKVFVEKLELVARRICERFAESHCKN